MPKDENTITQESPLAIQFPGDLLDWFAGQAMLGELASQDFTPNFECYYANDKPNRLVLAEKAYKIAEAMIAEKREHEK